MQLESRTRRSGIKMSGQHDDGCEHDLSEMDRADRTNRANILIVDDTPQNLIALEAILGDLGQNIVKASSGKEALRCLLKRDFAVILLDVNLPGFNGFETAALIRQRKNSEHTPIIFISAISTAELYSAKGYALGAVDYISTPVVPEVLRTKVAVFVDLYRKTEEVKRHSEQLRNLNEVEHQRKLSEAEVRLDLETKRNRFFNLSIEMLSIAGFDGYFKQLNPTWKAVLGFSEEELKAKPFMEFVYPSDQPIISQKLAQLQRNDSPIYFETRYACKDGSYRWLAMTAAPFTAEALIYLFARDITEKKRAEDEISKLNSALELRAQQFEMANQELEKEVAERRRVEEALRETNQELESFSYSVSHDLRAPLRAMQGFSEALLEDCYDGLGEMGREYAGRIISSANRMDALIQDLLVYSRVSHRELQLQPVSMMKVVAEAMKQLEAPLFDARAEVVIVPPMLPVVGHEATLVQVICNLISNAIKFTEKGVVPKVCIRMEQVENRVRLWVEDNGIGISPEYHTRIFRVFERLHGVEVYPGTGIGLAIVRKAIERMHGRVGLESNLNMGSRFWVELPHHQEAIGSINNGAD